MPILTDRFRYLVSGKAPRSNPANPATKAYVPTSPSYSSGEIVPQLPQIKHHGFEDISSSIDLAYQSSSHKSPSYAETDRSSLLDQRSFFTRRTSLDTWCIAPDIQDKLNFPPPRNDSEALNSFEAELGSMGDYHDGIYRNYQKSLAGLEVRRTSAAPSRTPSHRISDMMRPLSRATLTPADLLFAPPGVYRNTQRPEDDKALRTLGLASPSVPDSPSPPYSPPHNSQTPMIDTPHDEQGIPDGGRLALLHVFAGFLTAWNCWGLNLCMGPLLEFYASDLLQGTTPAKISWIASIQLSMIFFGALPVGRLADRGRYIHLFFYGGTAGMIGCVFSTAVCKTWLQLFFVQGLLTGLFMGLTFSSGVMVLMQYWERHLGVAMGVGAIGSSIGGIVYTCIIRGLLWSKGFPITMYVLGAFCAATMVLPVTIFRPNPKMSGLKAEQAPLLDWSAFKDLGFIFMVLGLFFAFLGLFFGFYYILSAGVSPPINLSNSQSTILLIVMLTCNVPGRVIPSFISDQCIGPINTLIPCCIFSSMFMFVWIGANNFKSLLLVAGFYGLCSAGIQSLYGSVIQSFNRRPPPPTAKLSSNPATNRRRARRGLRLVERMTENMNREMDPALLNSRTGMVFFVIGVACAIGTPIGQTLVGMSVWFDAEKFLPAQLFAGISLLVAAFCFLWARAVRVGWRAQRA